MVLEAYEAEDSKMCLLRPEGGIRVSQVKKCRMSSQSERRRGSDGGRERREL